MKPLYARIGHDAPNDKLWIFAGCLQVVSRGTGGNPEPRTHLSLWGYEAAQHYHGRYDARQQVCSVVVPASHTPEDSTTKFVVAALKEHFSLYGPTQFHFFTLLTKGS